MGHQISPTLPDTAPWRHVVELVADGADAAEVAIATTEAARLGLEKAKGDPGLTESIWLLTQTVLAARQPDFAASLRERGIAVPDQPGIFDVVCGVSDSLDRHLREKRSRTDIGEMAQLSAIEALTVKLTKGSANLFGTTAAEVQQTAYDLSTKSGFSGLAHWFFSCFARRFLTYHLGRELHNHVGGNGRFEDLTDETDFVEQLTIHCNEAAAITRTFAGEWYSKHNFQDGITRAKVRGFAAHAMTKLSKELQLRGDRHG